MHGQELPVDDGADGQLVEALHHEVVDFLVVLDDAVRPEIVVARQLAALVVAWSAHRAAERRYSGS